LNKIQRIDEWKTKNFYINVERHDWVERRRWFERHREREIVKLLRRLAHNNALILDVGCGTGLLTRHLTGLVIAIDINPWAVHKSRKNAPQANHIVGDAENLPIRSDTIGIITCGDTLEHLPNPDRAISESWRVLNRSGLLIGSVPCANIIWTSRVRSFFTPLGQLEPFHRTYRSSDILQLLEPFPFKNVYPDLLNLELFFVARRDIQEAPRVWETFWRHQSLMRRALRYLFNWFFVLLFLVNELRGASTILEVGVGSGSLAGILAKKLKRKVVGIDVSIRSAQIARRSIEDVLVCDACYLPFKQGVFHLAYSQGLVEHLSRPAAALSEMKLVSRRVVIAVPRCGGIFDLAHRFCYWIDLPWFWPDENYYTKDQLESLLGKTFTKSIVRSYFALDLVGYGY